MEFIKSKSKKSFVFTELICDRPSSSDDLTSEATILDESLFLIASSDLWYGDILVYLQTQAFWPNTSCSKQQCTRYQVKYFLIIGDTLYCRGVDTILRRCLTQEEAKKALNECHLSACGGHLSGYTTTHNFFCVGYFWPTIFKDCIMAIRSCRTC